MITEVNNEDETRAFGEKLGRLLMGGEVIELIGDVGAGKTSLTKGIARGLAITEDIQSPTFTISRQYQAPNGLTLAHYDFYRINDAGIMADELRETVGDDKTVVVIEWSNIVQNVLPHSHITVRLSSPTPTKRIIELDADKKLEDRMQ